MDYKEILEDEIKSKTLARVIAHLMCDGCVTERYLRYNNKNKFLIAHFKIDFEDLFPKSHFITGMTNSGTDFVQVQNKEIIAYLKSLCPSFKSGDLKVPKFIEDIEIKKEFIAATFDDEGCVALRTFKKTGEIKRNLDISSKSYLFLDGIKKILENELSIKCNKIISSQRKMKEKTFTTYKLSVTGKGNIEGFKSHIKFMHPEKKDKLNSMLGSYIRNLN